MKNENKLTKYELFLEAKNTNSVTNLLTNLLSYYPKPQEATSVDKELITADVNELKFMVSKTKLASQLEDTILFINNLVNKKYDLNIDYKPLIFMLDKLCLEDNKIERYLHTKLMLTKFEAISITEAENKIIAFKPNIVKNPDYSTAISYLTQLSTLPGAHFTKIENGIVKKLGKAFLQFNKTADDKELHAKVEDRYQESLISAYEFITSQPNKVNLNKFMYLFQPYPLLHDKLQGMQK